MIKKGIVTTGENINDGITNGQYIQLRRHQILMNFELQSREPRQVGPWRQAVTDITRLGFAHSGQARPELDHPELDHPELNHLELNQ